MICLRHLGVLFFDSTDANNPCQIACTIVLFVTCAINMIILPSIAADFDDWSEALCTSMTAVSCSTVTVSSILSRLIAHYNAKYKYRKYQTTLEGFRIYGPAADKAHLKAFSYTAVFVCMAVTVPVNCVKVYKLYNNHLSDDLMSAYFVCYYLQNLSMCCTELHFAIQCFVVYTKFREINDCLRRMDREQRLLGDNNNNCSASTTHSGVFDHCATTTTTTYHPFVVDAARTPDAAAPVVAPPRAIVYERDFYRPQDNEHPQANVIELLKIKHWLTREAVADLNSIFGIPIGLSMISITMAALMDVYTEVFFSHSVYAFNEVFRSKLLFFSWMLQYSFRFCLIVVTTHTTTKQAIKAKNLVTEMDNRYFDNSAKEELQLFYNQLSICSSDFTICDIFTLNVNLITSALAAGATYILVLVQLNKDN